MNSELNLVMLAVLITCTAFIGAANSKGSGKMIISYILAFVCLAVTAFKITQYSMALSKARNMQIAQEVGKKIEDKLELIEEKEDALREGASAAQQEEIDKYKSQAANIVYKMKEINQRLSGFRLEADTDDEYEELKNKASFYLGEAKGCKSRVKGLKAPKGVETIHENVVRAADVLLYASSKLRRYYNAENSEEEMQLNRIFRSKNRQATSLIGRAEMDLR